MNIAAIMPCRGRPEQTVANVKRLLATAGYDQWALIAVGGKDDQAILDGLHMMGVRVVKGSAQRLSYWQALHSATASADLMGATHLIGLANDLIPGMHWLRRAVDGYQATFGKIPGMLGFNGDSHEIGHSCHFLISRALLERYGGWPVWYDHNFGDTELCQRAIEDGVYAKAPWALLFHDHYYFGADNFDEVYREGSANVSRDQALFEQRRRLGWPAVVPDLDTQTRQSVLAQPHYTQ